MQKAVHHLREWHPYKARTARINSYDSQERLHLVETQSTALRSLLVLQDSIGSAANSHQRWLPWRQRPDFRLAARPLCPPTPAKAAIILPESGSKLNLILLTFSALPFADKSISVNLMPTHN